MQKKKRTQKLNQNDNSWAKKNKQNLKKQKKLDVPTSDGIQYYTINVNCNQELCQYAS